jgi:hypothetical protein
VLPAGRTGHQLAPHSAVLADAHPHWRPDHYELELPGTRVRFDFSVCKLLEFDEAQLRASREPAAVVVLAHLAAQRAKRDDQGRLAMKWELTRRLYRMGLAKADILQLFRLIDWLMRLPENLERRFRERLSKSEAKRVMPYITSIERFGIEKGRKQGRAEGRQEGQLLNCRQNILDLIEVRFGRVPRVIRQRVNTEVDLEKLRRWLREAAIISSLAELPLCFDRAHNTRAPKGRG